MTSANPALSKIRIVCISDTHNHGPGEGFKLPPGDVLVHAGDLTKQGKYPELQKAAEWLAKTDFAVKIVIAGNHDRSLDADCSFKYKDDAERTRKLLDPVPGVTYLQHTAADIPVPGKNVTLRVFGSPCTPLRPGKGRDWAFQYPAEEAKTLWKAIPSDIDILVTHSPPAGYCDTSDYWGKGGCDSLTKAVQKVRPALHVCGHCHEGRGAQIVRWSDDVEVSEHQIVSTWEDPGVGNKKISRLDLTGKGKGKPLEVGRQTAIVNAAIMMRSHDSGPISFNKPIVVDLMFPTTGPAEDEVRDDG